MQSRTKSIMAVLAVGLLVTTGCSGPQKQDSAASGEDGVIRFTFSPDPAWDWIQEQGILEEMEKDSGFRILQTVTWDEFAYFAGGHGDIVSTATYELPLLEEKTGIQTVTFGKYNLLRITPLAAPGKNYTTLADIPKGSKIGVPSAVSSTLVWGMYAEKLHDLDFRVGGGRLRARRRGPLRHARARRARRYEAALAIPEAAIPYMRKGELEVMYDGKLPYEVYGEICSCGTRGSWATTSPPQEVVRRPPEGGRGLPRPLGGGHQGLAQEPGEDHRDVPAALRRRGGRGRQGDDGLHRRTTTGSSTRPTSRRSGSTRRRKSSSCSRTPGWSNADQPDPEMVVIQPPQSLMTLAPSTRRLLAAQAYSLAGISDLHRDSGPTPRPEWSPTCCRRR